MHVRPPRQLSCNITNPAALSATRTSAREVAFSLTKSSLRVMNVLSEHVQVMSSQYEVAHNIIGEIDSDLGETADSLGRGHVRLKGSSLMKLKSNSSHSSSSRVSYLYKLSCF